MSEETLKQVFASKAVDPPPVQSNSTGIEVPQPMSEQWTDGSTSAPKDVDRWRRYREDSSTSIMQDTASFDSVSSEFAPIFRGNDKVLDDFSTRHYLRPEKTF